MKKDLSNICLVVIDGVGNKNEEINRVLKYSTKNIICKCIFYFSPVNNNSFEAINGNILFRKNIPSMSYYEYNKFCVNGLYDSIKDYDFNYCLLMQEDGFILNADLWDDSFLNFDYIGAPWLRYLNSQEEEFWWLERNNIKYRVGNGGFSLRSRKFLFESSKIDYPPNSTHEDVYLTRFHGDYLETKGIKFADIVTASKFSLETKNDICDNIHKVFGFHGKHLLQDAWQILDQNNK